MKRSDWEKIAAARELLQLEETASLKQIKVAFRRLSKKHHPDLAVQGENGGFSMQEVNEAYDVLLQYCKGYRFPLTPESSGQLMEAEDWWMDRFGQDPVWGKKS